MEPVFDMFPRKLENNDDRRMWATTRCYEFCLQFIYHLRKLVGNPSPSLETPDKKSRICWVMFQFHFINATFNREWMTRIETPSWIWGEMTGPPNPLFALKNNGYLVVGGSLEKPLAALLGMCSPPGALTTLKLGKRPSEIRRMM